MEFRRGVRDKHLSLSGWLLKDRNDGDGVRTSNTFGIGLRGMGWKF